MRKIWFVFILLLTVVVLGIQACGNSNNPSSPGSSSATSTPTSVSGTPAPVPPTATPTSLVVNSGPLLATPVAQATVSIPSSSNFGIRFAANSTSNFWITDDNYNALEGWTVSGSGPSPNITSFNTGNTYHSPLGIGVDQTTGNIYTCDAHNSRVVVFNSSGTYLTTLTYVSFSEPYGVAVNSAGTTLCVLDGAANEVFVFTITGSAVSPTYTYYSNFGSGTLGAGPANLSFDSGNNVWIADQVNYRIVEYSGLFLSGTPYTIPKVTGSPYTMGQPFDVVVDHSGYIYVADHNEGYVQVFNSSFTHVENLLMDAPTGVALDPTETYVYSVSSNSINGFKIR
jgi:DNA-binding beta-propeller fold protein YncE